jgi:hypothetical protein
MQRVFHVPAEKQVLRRPSVLGLLRMTASGALVPAGCRAARHHAAVLASELLNPRQVSYTPTPPETESRKTRPAYFLDSGSSRPRRNHMFSEPYQQSLCQFWSPLAWRGGLRARVRSPNQPRLE